MSVPLMCDLCESEKYDVLATRVGDDDDYDQLLHVCNHCFRTVPHLTLESSGKSGYVEIGCRVCGTSLGMHLLPKGTPVWAECKRCWNKNEPEVSMTW